jgi:TRAP-type transport system small permease protein
VAVRRLLDRATRALEGISALLLLALMLIVLVDVVLRSAVNQPLPWGTELLEVVLGAMIFLLYPVLAIGGGHITVDLIATRPSVQRFQRVLAHGIGATLFALIAWCLARQALRAAGYGEGTPLLHIPYAAVLGVMAVLAAVTACAFTFAAMSALRRSEATPVATAVLEPI